MVRIGDKVMERIVAVLSGLVVPPGLSEVAIHREIAGRLESAGIVFEGEKVLGPRMRADFFCEGGVLIEVKKGKPGSRALAEQVERYAGCDEVKAVVLVVERSVWVHPHEVAGKPVAYVSLSKNRGLAL